jgi:NAD-dependent deacetylase
LKTYRIKKEKIKKFIQKLKEGKNSRTKLYRLYRNLYPECKCGSHFRPDVVLFGEPLDQQVVNKAYQLLNDCHYLLLIGTSSVVYPASSLPVYAKEQGAKIIEINPESTELSNIADYNIYDNAGSVFKKIDNILK